MQLWKYFLPGTTWEDYINVSVVPRFNSTHSGTGNNVDTPGTPGFACSFGQHAILEELCDGVVHCPNGEDESNPLCESKLACSPAKRALKSNLIGYYNPEFLRFV